MDIFVITIICMSNIGTAVAFSWAIEGLAAQSPSNQLRNASGAKVSNQKMRMVYALLEKSRKVHQNQPCEEHLASAQYVRQCCILVEKQSIIITLAYLSALTSGSSMSYLFEFIPWIAQGRGSFHFAATITKQKLKGYDITTN